RKLMEVAKARIDRFLHVGVTDRLFDSVAAAVRGQLCGGQAVQAVQCVRLAAGHWIHITHPDGSQYYFNKVLNSSRWNLTEEERQRLLPPLDPYNNPLVMPLHEFIRHPIAKELLH
ncbi:uncharacterized protein HaLaN_32440, partial [Haematococcus lacustris]